MDEEWKKKLKIWKIKNKNNVRKKNKKLEWERNGRVKNIKDRMEGRWKKKWRRWSRRQLEEYQLHTSIMEEGWEGKKKEGRMEE